MHCGLRSLGQRSPLLPSRADLHRRVKTLRRDVVRSLVRAAYRFRDAALIAEKKNDFGNALQNLYRELERAENLVGPS